MKRSLSENTSFVSRSDKTMSVRNLPGEWDRWKFMKKMPYTAFRLNFHSAPRSPCRAMARER